MQLNERYINVFEDKDKEKCIDEVLELIRIAYAPIGGAAGCTKEKLMKPDTFFKLVRKGGKLVACAVYSYRSASNTNTTFFDPKRNERKIRYVGQDGSKEGKDAVKTIMRDDIVRPERGFWGEVSGKVEKMYIQRGAVPIPNTVAVDILKNDFKRRDVVKLDPDGYHYWREIGGEPHRKMLIGNANIIEQGLDHRKEVKQQLDSAPEYDINSAREDDDLNEGLTILDFVKKSMKL